MFHISVFIPQFYFHGLTLVMGIVSLFSYARHSGNKGPFSTSKVMK
jgi:hypothetical protein